jgi:hypothetical protein
MVSEAPRREERGAGSGARVDVRGVQANLFESLGSLAGLKHDGKTNCDLVRYVGLIYEVT